MCLWPTDIQQGWGKTILAPNGAGTTGYHMQKNQMDPYLTPYINVNSEWIENLNVRVILFLLKPLEEKLGVNFYALGYGNGFLLDIIAIYKPQKKTIDKLDFIRIKIYCV
jgi:hypothetical protein